MKKSEIPSLAFIEAQVLQHPDLIGAHRKVVRHVEEGYGVARGSLGDGVYHQTRIPSLLYLLILLPKESRSLDENDPIYSQMRASVDLSVFSVTGGKNDYADPYYNFIHRLRNAVAHCRFEFGADSFEFSDQNGFRAKASIEDTWRFLSQIGPLLANLRNQRSSVVQ